MYKAVLKATSFFSLRPGLVTAVLDARTRETASNEYCGYIISLLGDVLDPHSPLVLGTLKPDIPAHSVHLSLHL